MSEFIQNGEKDKFDSREKLKAADRMLSLLTGKERVFPDDESHDEERDTREKLEEDIRQVCDTHDWETSLPSVDAYDLFIAVIDRQAAITEREYFETKCHDCQDAHDRQTYANIERYAKLKAKVDALEAENAELRDTITAKNVKIKEQAKNLTHMQNALRARNEGVLKPQWRAEIEELEAKNAELQNNVYELKGELEWRTCTLEYDGKWLICSNCGKSMQWFGVRTVYKGDTQERALGVDGVRFCAFCGARIEMDGESE